MQRLYSDSEELLGDGRTKRVTVTETITTPCGTRSTSTQSYNYKSTPPDGESAQARENRLRVKRKARGEAIIKFDPTKHEAKKNKRRKHQKQQEATAPPAVVHEHADAPAQRVAAPRAAAVPRNAAQPSDPVAQRDWAMLRAFAQLKRPAAVLTTLQLEGHDDEQPLSVLAVQERHDFLCRAVRAVVRLVAAVEEPSACMNELACLSE